MDLNRRTVLGMVGAGTVMAASGALPTLAQGSRELVIVTYPGALSGPHRWLADRIEARHPGLRIRLVPSDSQDIVAQIKAAQGHVPYDAGPNDEPPHLIGLSEGYLAPRDDAAIPNLANALPEFTAKSQGAGVPATYSLVGLAVNTNVVPERPQGWSDLWAPRFAGQVGIARTSSNLGLVTLVQAAKTFGGSEDDLEPGWQKLKELAPRAARSPAALTQMLEREEIALAPLWNNNTAGLAQQGLPIGFVKPAEGPVAILSFFSGFANSAHPDLVAEWLNGILSQEYQAHAAGAPYYFGPTVTGVAVPPEAAPFTPSSTQEIAALQTIDWTKIVPRRAELVDRFDREFSV